MLLPSTRSPYIRSRAPSAHENMLCDHVSREQHLEAGLQLIPGEEEKTAFLDGQASRESKATPRPASPRRSSSTMLNIRRFCTLVLCMALSFALVTSAFPLRRQCRHETDAAGPGAARSQTDAGDRSSAFSQLLHSASPSTLHELLHEFLPEKYRHGVYESEHDALRAVHAESPKLATAMAALAKRVDNANAAGSNSTSSPASTSAGHSTSQGE